MRREAHRNTVLRTSATDPGVVAVIAFVLGGLFFVPDDAVLHDWAGLHQRVFVLAVLSPCRIVLALRLLQVVDRPQSDRVGVTRDTPLECLAVSGRAHAHTGCPVIRTERVTRAGDLRGRWRHHRRVACSCRTTTRTGRTTYDHLPAVSARRD
jgi:hypothetical protein